jgi:4-hydroxy-tetrahydrodipicolinate synthase
MVIGLEASKRTRIQGAPMVRNLMSFVVSLTPFQESGEFDEHALRAHLQRLSVGGVGVYLAGGGSSEAYTLSQAEIARVLEIGLEELQGTVPVRYAGMEPRTALEMIDQGRLATSVGIETMQVYSLEIGHAKKPDHRELESYLRDVFEAVTINCVLSSNKSVGYFLPIDMLRRLAGDYPHFVGVNSSNPDLGYVHELVDALGHRLEILVGGPEQALQNFAFGGHGYLTTEGNIAPKLAYSVLTHYESGDMQKTFEAWGTLVRLKTLIGRFGGISATKEALRLYHLPGGYPRRPRLPLTEEQSKGLASALDKLGVGEIEGIG